MVEITKHAVKRARERLGLPKKAIEKMVETAFQNGKMHSDFSGALKRYLDGIFLKERNANNMRIWNGHLFIFNNDTLITAWRLPQRYQKAALQSKEAS